VDLARFLVGFQFVIFIYYLVHFVFICLLLLHLRVALFWFILFPNLIVRTFVVAGLLDASVCKSSGVYWFVSVGFQWILPGGIQVP
jgi:hypothetical protein